MLVYLAAAYAGSRGKVGKLCPLQGTANPIKELAFGNWILKFPDLFFATRKPVTARVITEPRLRRFNSAFASRTFLDFGRGAPGTRAAEYPPLKRKCQGASPCRSTSFK